MIDQTATTTSSLKTLILEENLSILSERINTQGEVNAHISNQIEVASYTLDAIALIATIAGIFLAVFINRSYEKITNIRREVEDTKAYVDGHNDQLYQRLKRNDTLNLLKRLTEVPEDIHNISPLLFSRELLEEDFATLKRAYLSEDLDIDGKRAYIPVLMQHFPYLALTDEQLRPTAISSLSDLRQMFKCDLENLFGGVVKYLKLNGMAADSSKEIVKNLVNGLFVSKHKGLIISLKQECSKQNLDIPRVFQDIPDTNTNENFVSWLNS